MPTVVHKVSYNEAMFKCPACGQPVPSIMWYKDGNPICFESPTSTSKVIIYSVISQFAVLSHCVSFVVRSFYHRCSKTSEFSQVSIVIPFLRTFLTLIPPPGFCRVNENEKVGNCWLASCFWDHVLRSLNFFCRVLLLSYPEIHFPWPLDTLICANVTSY